MKLGLCVAIGIAALLAGCDGAAEKMAELFPTKPLTFVIPPGYEIAVDGKADFQFHEGVLLAARESPAAELVRYAQLWTSDGSPVMRSRNLAEDLELPPQALATARRGAIAWDSHIWHGHRLRCVIYPLRLVGAAHAEHLLQIAAPLEPLERTVTNFAWLVVALTLLAAGAAGLAGWRLAGAALQPTREITAQAEAIEAGTLSARITAHADVREFERLVMVLNAMLGRLEQAFETQRRFTADASHELRAPLTALRGEIEVALKRERTSAEYRITLERCHEEVLRLSRLASDLLVLARSESGQAIERPQEVDCESSWTGSFVDRNRSSPGAAFRSPCPALARSRLEIPSSSSGSSRICWTTPSSMPPSLVRSGLRLSRGRQPSSRFETADPASRRRMRLTCSLRSIVPTPPVPAARAAGSVWPSLVRPPGRTAVMSSAWITHPERSFACPCQCHKPTIRSPSVDRENSQSHGASARQSRRTSTS